MILMNEKMMVCSDHFSLAIHYILVFSETAGDESGGREGGEVVQWRQSWSLY